MRLVIFLAVFAVVHSAMGIPDNWTLEISVDNSDLLIGYISDLRGAFPGSLNCSGLDTFHVIMLESVVYAVNFVNAEILSPYNLSVGVIGFDVCDNTQIAYQKGIGFIQGKDTRSCDANVPDDQAIMKQSSSSHCVDPNDPQVHIVAGLMNSEMSLGLGPLFQYFCIPLIASYASSDRLTNVNPYFLRTIPPNSKLVEPLIDLLVLFNWTVVNVVYDDSEYGQNIYEMFQKANEARLSPICIRNLKSLKTNSREKWPTPEDLQEWHNDAEVIVALLDYMNAADLFKVVASSHLKFQLVGSDGWSSMRNSMTGVEMITVNAITVEPIVRDDPGFRAYLSNLTLGETPNPWMKAVIADQNDCWLEQSGDCPSGNCSQPCRLDQKLKMNEVEPMAIWRSHFVIEVIDLFARAVESICKSNLADCGKRPMLINGQVLLDRLLSTTLNDSLAQFQWDGRSGPPDFSIMQFGLNETTDQYEWHPVGEYINGSLNWLTRPKFDDSLMESVQKKVSDCQKICGSNQKQTNRSPTCCKDCVTCTDKEHLVNNTCETCPHLHESSNNECVLRPSITFFTHDGYNAAMFAISLAGLLISFLLVGFFFVKRSTPIVLVLFGRSGLLLVPAVTILFLSSLLSLSCPAGYWFCMTNVYLWVLGLTVAFSVLCAKVLRVQVWNHIELKAIFPYRYCSTGMDGSTRLVMACSLAVFHFIFFMVLALAKCPPEVSLTDVDQKKYRVCSVTHSAFALLNLIPVTLLVIITGIFGYRGRESSLLVCRQESTQCLIAAVGVILSFVVYLPLNFLNSSGAELIGITNSCRSLLPALVLLLICLLPQAYTMLWRPHENTFKSLNKRFLSEVRHIGPELYLITIEPVSRRSASTGNEPSPTPSRQLTGNEPNPTPSHQLTGNESSRNLSRLSTGTFLNNLRGARKRTLKRRRQRKSFTS